MLEFGVSPVLQRVDLLGLACLHPPCGPRPLVADTELGRATDPRPENTARAVWALRVAAGAALIIVAFAEKLAEPRLALAFLADNPDLNVARVDRAASRRPRVHPARRRDRGSVRLLLISGALAQVVVLAAGIPFNATLWFFGTTELVGHLPTYGTMLLLLVYASDPVLRPGRRGALAVDAIEGATPRRSPPGEQLTVLAHTDELDPLRAARRAGSSAAPETLIGTEATRGGHGSTRGVPRSGGPPRPGGRLLVRGTAERVLVPSSSMTAFGPSNDSCSIARSASTTSSSAPLLSACETSCSRQPGSRRRPGPSAPRSPESPWSPFARYHDPRTPGARRGERSARAEIGRWREGQDVPHVAPAGIAFDAFGTLFDLDGLRPAMERAAPGRGSDLLSASPRASYPPRGTSRVGTYRPFPELAALAVRGAALELALEVDEQAAEEIAGGLASLPTMGGAAHALDGVRSVPLAVLSNGTADGIRSLVGGAGLADRFDHLLAADEVGRFKPAPEVYRLAVSAFATAEASEVVLVSGNEWDVAGAQAAGLRTAWISHGRPQTRYSAPRRTSSWRSSATCPPPCSRAEPGR
jgi:2-haloacid dehalogenase